MLTSPRNVEFVEKCVKSITDKPPHKPLDSAGVCGAGTPDDPVRTSAWGALNKVLYGGALALRPETI